MAFGITPTGFVKRTFQEIKLALETTWQQIDPLVDLDADGPVGQRIAMWAQEQADAWDLLQDLYTTHSPSEVTGAAQDKLYSLLGLLRIDASPTITRNVIHWGSLGTTIPAGSLVRTSSSQKQQVLQDAVDLLDGTWSAVQVSMNTPSNGMVFTLVVDGVTSTVTAGSSSTKDTIATSLLSSLNPLHITTYSDGIITIQGLLGTTGYITPFTLSGLVSLAVSKYGRIGTYSCDEDGPIPIPARAIDTIVTPASGWLAVTNPYAGVTGRLAETDAQFRLRQGSFYAGGLATDAAMRSKILNEVDGVTAVTVISNRSMVTDPNGIPPKAYLAIVDGGTDLDIASTLLLSQPAGIESFGTTSISVVDGQGVTQVIKFSRSTPAYIWVKVTRTLDTEVPYPATGDSQIKAAIVEWALTKYVAGKNVYCRDILTPINTVPGLADVTVELGNTRNGSAPGSYSGAAMLMVPTELPVFDVTRISVI